MTQLDGNNEVKQVTAVQFKTQPLQCIVEQQQDHATVGSVPSNGSYLSWGSFYAFPLRLCLCFELLHMCTDQKLSANANKWLTQMQTHTRRHYTTMA